MQTKIIQKFLASKQGLESEKILRSCVHCGFCNATCPTYQLLGDELDGPRGRIYQIKQILEGQPATRNIQIHLDRCLTCRSCETTCPSGVNYSQLLDHGRQLVEKTVPRPLSERIMRQAILRVMPYPEKFKLALRVGGLFKPLLPTKIKNKIPTSLPRSQWAPTNQSRKMLILEGCVQPALNDNINAATSRVLNKLGIQVIRAKKAGCCGALTHHLSDDNKTNALIKANIDAWWPYIEDSDANRDNIEAIVITASGCSAMVKDYGHILQHDKNYQAKAKKISELAKDISEIVAEENIEQLKVKLKLKTSDNVVFQSPCTLQHGQKKQGFVENLLQRLNLPPMPYADPHLCCGSAGTYSLLQSELSTQLGNNKIKNLAKTKPDVILSANIGCINHLQSMTDVPVKHWIEFIDEACC